MKRIFLTLTLVLFVIPLGISQDLPSYVPTDGLVAYYPFNGNANDASGNGHHGTVNGATLTTDRGGNENSSYIFDGNDDFIESQIDQSQSFTVAIWVKLNRNDQYFGFVQHKDNCIRGGGYILGIHTNGNYRYTSSNCGECQSNPCSNSYEINYINSDRGFLSTNLWYHLGVTNDGFGNYTFYLNGEAIGSENNNNMIFDYGIKPFSIGKHHDGSNLFYLNGSLDDVGLWNRALSEQEIQNLYNSSNGDILLNGTVSAESNQIKNVADPTDAQDVVTKSYLVTSQSSTYSQQQVDQIISNLQEQINTLKAQSVNYGSNTFSSVIEVQNSLKPKEQIFTISDNTVSNTIQGTNGTVIYINPNAITLNGSPYTGVVKATLDEYLTPNSMILSGIQTTSNGELLVTGGSFELDLEGENGEDLELSNWSANASMPLAVSLSSDFTSAMRFYVGERLQIEGREQVNWELNNVSQEFDPPWQGFSQFYGLNIGLSNCDVLYSSVVQGLGTQFSVLLEGVTDYNNAIVWMFINDFPSVVQITSLIENEQGFKTYADSIPVGLNATLLAIYVDEDDYLKFGTLEINVQGDEVFTIPMSFGTKDSLKSLIENF